MRAALLLAALAAPALALEEDALGLDTHTSWQGVVTLGLPVGVLEGEVPVPHPVVDTLTHELDSDWRPGASLTLAMQRTTVNGGGLGWHIEFGLALERWNGAIVEDTIGNVGTETSADVTVDTGMLTVACGFTSRWDEEDIRLLPSDWQLDLAPMIGFGLASVTVGDGASSDIGPAWTVGARARLTAALGDGWRLGGQLGVAWSEVRARWDDTDEAVFHGMGPTVALVLVYGH